MGSMAVLMFVVLIMFKPLQAEKHSKAEVKGFNLFKKRSSHGYKTDQHRHQADAPRKKKHILCRC